MARDELPGIRMNVSMGLGSTRGSRGVGEAAQEIGPLPPSHTTSDHPIAVRINGAIQPSLQSGR